MASWVALAAVTGSLVVYAIGSDGQATHRADLNDGGIWVTNQAIDAIARQNKPVQQLDAYIPGGSDGVGADADVLQDGSAVVSVAGAQLTPVDAGLGKALVDSSVEAVGTTTLAGGTIASVDSEAGQVRAARVDTVVGVTGLAEVGKDAKPLAEIGTGARGVATRSGAVVAASPSGRAIVVRPGGTGFGAPIDLELAAPAGGIAQITAVGETPVVLDEQGRVVVGEHVAEIADADAVAGGTVRLQQPGPAADDVLVATADGLFAVSLDEGTSRRVADGSGSKVVAPVVLAECAFAVWADGTAGSISTVCGNAKADGPRSFAVNSDAELVFRINRGEVVLNDIKDGSVWTVDGAKPVQIADWQAFTQKQKQEEDDDEEERDERQVRQAPQAKPDTFGVRVTGRATVLHVLDNDLVSGGGVLTISDVEKPSQAGVSVQVAPDRQTLLLTLPRGFAGNPTFGYTVDDGSGGKDATDDGVVTILNRAPDDPQTAPPTLRPGAKTPTYPLASSSDVEFSVLADWRDNEYGDPVSLDIDGLAVPEGLEASATADGLVRVRAAGHVGPATLKYKVSTGGSASTGVVRLNVLAPSSRKIESPQPQPDVVSGQVGGAITASPLDNDIPGADPSEPTARLEIAGNVAPARGLAVETDLQSGRVTIRARQAGRFQLDYTAGFGAAKRVTSTITVVVEKSDDDGDLPIPAPDTATAYGTSPVVVDVLANDFDPKGRVLGVINAKPTLQDGGLEVAVVDGRWLRISALSPDLAPPTQDIEYTVSNGAASAKSSVSITQKPPLPAEKNIPVTTDDEVVVRAGDTTLVPVLDNDSTPSGDPIGLTTLVTDGVPLGELAVTPALGRAYVSGRNVRYVPPGADEVDGPTTVEITYVAQNTADPSIQPTSGVLRAQITPAPTDETPNQTPTPRAVEGRVVQGDEVTLRLPLVGNDPDGDSVSLVGIQRAPALGRLLSVGANTIVYQAFPGAAGTDDFSFIVHDMHGAAAVGSARVAVTQAGAPQAPVAVNDVVIAAPDREIEIDVLANDFRTPGTELRLLPLEDAPDGVSADEESQFVRATAPGDRTPPIEVPYRISSGFDESAGALQISSEDGYNNPPVVEDAFAELEGDTAEVVVDVLASAYDIDGEGKPVVLESVGGVGTSFDDDGKVSVPVTDNPQVIPFRVVDGEQASSSAAIYVPAKRKGTPYLTSEDAIQLDPGSSLKIALQDLVADPEGDPVFLTVTEQITAAPATLLTATAPDNKTLELTATKEARGPGSLTFEVSDREKVDDPERHVAVLTVPVTIGDGSPLVTCPRETISVVEGGASRALDIATVCHVWTPEPSAAAELQYSADWAVAQEVPGVEVSNDDDGIVLTASTKAKSDTSGVLELSVDGEPALDAAGKRATMLVKVVPAGPPSLAGISVEGETGKATSIDVAAYARSPFGSAAEWVIVGKPVQIEAPGPVKVSTEGTTVRITPSEYGVHVLRVSLADNGDATGKSRPRAEGVIRVAVVAAPDRINDLRWDRRVQDGAATLTWTPPSTGGGSIRYYTLSYGGKDTKCPSNRCTVNGLDNGKDLSFTVTATNQYGTSKPSNTTVARPDRVPDAVKGLKVVQQLDGQVLLEWSAPSGDYSAITDYNITWPGSGSIRTSGGRTAFTARPLPNGTPTTFQVWAVNETGPGPKSPVTGEGAGKPPVPTLKNPTIPNPTDTAQKAVTISWDSVGPNGPGPVEYFVTAYPGGQVCPGSGWTKGTSCADSLANNGKTTTYKVKARNAEAVKGRAPSSNYTSAESAGKTVEAAAPPEGARNVSAVATGNDGETRVTFDVGASHGAKNEIHCAPGCGDLKSNNVGNGGASGLSFVLGNLSDGDTTSIRIWTCNGSSGGAQTGSACSAEDSDGTTTFGSLGTPSISVGTGGTCFNITASGDANGKQATMTVSADGYSRSWTFSKTQTVTDSYCPGHSQTRNFTARITDSSSTNEQPKDRGSSERSSGNVTTPAPPATVSISRGSSAVGQPGCTAAKCAYLVVTTSGFPTAVSCQITAASNGLAGFVPWSQGANQTKQNGNYFGHNWITVRCSGGGVSATGTRNPW